MQNKPDSSPDYSVKLLSQPFKQSWAVLMAFIIGFGLLGYVAGFAVKPVYEAIAVITTNLDLKVDRPVTTEIMIDSQIKLVGDLLWNQAITDELIDRESREGQALSLEDLKEMATIERQLMNTLIKVKGSDPERITRIANTWAEIGFETFQEATRHGLKASEARARLVLVEYCFPASKPQPDPSTPAMTTKEFCEDLDYAEADKVLKETYATLAEEEPKSLGLSPYLNISQLSPASTPTRPQSLGQGWLSFGGAVLGLVAGIFYVEIDPKRRK